MDTGSLRQAVTKGHIESVPLVIPTGAVLDSVWPGSSIRLSCELSSNDEFAIATLAALRDTLLPKLISGELRVKERGRGEAFAQRHPQERPRSTPANASPLQEADLMPYNPDTHRRRSIRLKGYDYTQAGAYFVTICAYQRECLFGQLENGLVVSSHYGRIAERCWKVLPRDFPRVELDVFVVMPNHLHGISCPYRPATPQVGAKHSSNGPRSNRGAFTRECFAPTPGTRYSARIGGSNRAKLQIGFGPQNQSITRNSWYASVATRLLRTHHPR